MTPLKTINCNMKPFAASKFLFHEKIHSFFIGGGVITCNFEKIMDFAYYGNIQNPFGTQNCNMKPFGAQKL